MVVIDAGHGGEDPGAVGNGIIEKDLNLSISKYMENRFNELNIPTKMTRIDDETLDPTERVTRIMDAFGPRTDVIVISNHINASGGDGAEVIYPLRNNNVLPNLILSEIEKAGQNVRKAYQRRLPSDPIKDYYYLQRDTAPLQTIMVEYGFLDSPLDDVYQLKNFSNDYAEAVVKAVSEYLGVPYFPLDGVSVYIVKKGDSLWSIARQLNTTVAELKTINNLTSDLLSIGQSLKIPQVEETPIISKPNIHIVKRGDNLYDIARKHNTTVTELMRINNLSSTLLSIGQNLKLPGTEIIEPEIPITQHIEYIVKSGDNLYAIARKYNTTVDEIKRSNNLTSNLLSIGQRLIIPAATTTITYVVKSGDNLYAIARKYDTSVAEIKRKNNLTSNLLNIGQILTI